MNTIRPPKTKLTKVILPTGRGELILVVDDEEALLGLTQHILHSSGYRVMTAQNGLQGVARFRENQDEIKLVITDSGMPEMNGMGMIRAIRELKPDLPIIMASGSDSDMEELQRIDPIHLKSLGKPYSIDQLLTAVDLAFRIH
jgi:two-component system cell cycle sensor histidine kinase/response regulator CckA